MKVYIKFNLLLLSYFFAKLCIEVIKHDMLSLCVITEYYRDVFNNLYMWLFLTSIAHFVDICIV